MGVLTKLQNMYLIVLLYFGIYGSLGDRDCMFGESDSCFLPCRCLVDSDGGCDKTTGVCNHDNQSCLHAEPSDTWIGHDWSGPKCQTGNVAYRKAAYLKEGDLLEKYDELTDANLSQDKCLSLADKTDLENVVLLLDLGTKHKLTSVTLYLSDENRGGITIAVGDDPGAEFDNYVVCGESSTPSSQKVTISCQSVTRYISITVADSNMTVCEIIATGHIYKNIDCSTCNGECYFDLFCATCKAGLQTPDCVQDCPDGTYGTDCQSECGHCLNGEACDKVTGQCDNGCNMWYVPEDTCLLYLGTSDMLHNVYSPGLRNATDNSLIATLSQFRIQSRKSEFQWNYILGLAYAENDEEYKTTEDRIYEGAIGVYGTAFTIYHLQPNTFYYVKTSLYRRWGDREELIGYSTPVAVRTKCTAPRAPGLQVEPLTQGEILVSWKNISSGCDYIKYTELLYSLTEVNKTSFRSKFVTGTIYAISLNVEDNKRYYLKVRAKNNADLESESEVFLYDPAHYQGYKKEGPTATGKTTCKEANEKVPGYVYALICITGVALLIIMILMFFFYRKITAMKNVHVYQEAVPPSVGYGNSAHYDAVL